MGTNMPCDSETKGRNFDVYPLPTLLLAADCRLQDWNYLNAPLPNGATARI
ncbi:hypothetical protein LBMAG21_08170 [Armatimonadota bacterium]|nr:hypothetical protein LBMAG21_08170 [Armatimonadota bacterium]